MLIGVAGTAGWIPVTVSGVTKAVAVTAGAGPTCALLSSGSIQCWGYDSNGQLGNGASTDSFVPVPVSGISNAIAVTAGCDHSCALLSGGSIQCWGSNNRGMLGSAGYDSPVPVAVSNISDAIAVATLLRLSAPVAAAVAATEAAAPSCALLSIGSKIQHI